MREALGSIPSVSTFENDAFSSAADNLLDINYCSTRRASDSVSEWLRRWTRNPLGSARRGSNPLAVVFLFSDPRFSAMSTSDSNKMRMPGVEPGSQAWEACMMPLHYMRSASKSPAFRATILYRKLCDSSDEASCENAPREARTPDLEVNSLTL